MRVSDQKKCQIESKKVLFFIFEGNMTLTKIRELIHLKESTWQGNCSRSSHYQRESP